MRKSICFILIATILSFSACSRANEPSKQGLDTAANFTLETIDGGKIVLSDVLKDKKVVLLFWTTWCYFCRKELPQAERFYLENQNQVVVIGINVQESKAKVARFMRKEALTFPIALDHDGSVAQLYNVRGIPAVFAVDQNSRIMYDGHSIEEMASQVDF